MKRIIRQRWLTPEEAKKDQSIREQVDNVKTQFKPGDRVKVGINLQDRLAHFRGLNPDILYGVITETYEDGRCLVLFSMGNFDVKVVKFPGDLQLV